MISTKARAKINIAIDVIGKREDGYHEVEMIMQEIDLYDEIKITELVEDKIVIKTNLDFLPNDSTNIAYKAAELIKNKFNIKSGVEIDVEKNIPVSAGLAGGSTDAAAVLKSLNKLWNLNQTTEELMVIGKKIGADVPFCILGGCAVAKGIGEKLTPIKGIDRWVLLVKPNVFISTEDVYRKLKLDKLEKRPDINKIIEAIENEDINAVYDNMENVLESVTAKEYEVIGNIKSKMIQCQADVSLMSGSGSSVFGLYRDYKKAKTAYKNIQKIYKDIFLIKTYNKKSEE